MDVFSMLCSQWAEQCRELQQQRAAIDETITRLEEMIARHGGRQQLPRATEVNPGILVQPLPDGGGGEEPREDIPGKETHAPDLSGYDADGSWADKITFALSTDQGARMPQPVTGIADIIHDIEPALELNRIIKAVTMEASKLGLNGKLGIRKKGNKNFYFVPKQTAGEQSQLGFSG